MSNEQKIAVTLTGPAKIDGKREPAGKGVTVSILTALQLAASGSINPEAASMLAQAATMPETYLSAEVDEAIKVAEEVRDAYWTNAMDHFETMAEDREKAAVVAAIAEREAHWSTAMDHFETMAEDRQAVATAELTERLEQAETKIEVQRKTIADLNQALAAATAPKVDDTNTEEPGKKPGSKAKA